MHNLRRQLVMRLLWPLLALFLAGAYVSYFVAAHFANLAYDRWLYDSARALAQQVRLVGGAARLELPKAAIEMFEWDDLDRTYYAVNSRKQGLVFGHITFPMPPVPVARDLDPTYYDATIEGRPTRVVAIRLSSENAADNGDEITIQVGETLAKRNVLTREILLALVVPQGLLIAVAVFLIWHGVAGGVRPLSDLARQIEARRPGDLRPVGETVPEEVEPLTRSLNELFRQLEHAHSAQQRFIAQAAHQLRTPLAALQVQAERALREPNPQAHEEALRRVLGATSRLNHLSHQLLTLARAEPEAGADRRLIEVDVAGIAREVASEWVPAALEREIDLGYAGPYGKVMLKGEPLLLRELLGNLIDNALQYGSKGGHVTVGIIDDQAAGIYVEDDGPGIPAESRAAVMEPFFRLPGSMGQGCGLGLAIVREIASLHNATVTIGEGAAGRGTRVSVAFDRSAGNQNSAWSRSASARTGPRSAL